MTFAFHPGGHKKSRTVTDAGIVRDCHNLTETCFTRLEWKSVKAYVHATRTGFQAPLAEPLSARPRLFNDLERHLLRHDLAGRVRHYLVAALDNGCRCAGPIAI